MLFLFSKNRVFSYEIGTSQNYVFQCGIYKQDEMELPITGYPALFEKENL